MDKRSSDSGSKSNLYKGFNILSAEAPLPILIPLVAAEVLMSSALLLLIFWLGYGEINDFFWGFIVFVAALQILTVVGLRFRNRKDFHARKKFKGDWADYIGGWWLMSCFFGAFIGWLCGTLADNMPEYWQVFHLAKIFFTIILPVLTMLPLLRYVAGKAALVQIPLLFFVTLLPILVGLNSVIGLWNGVKP